MSRETSFSVSHNFFISYKNLFNCHIHFVIIVTFLKFIFILITTWIVHTKKAKYLQKKLEINKSTKYLHKRRNLLLTKAMIPLLFFFLICQSSMGSQQARSNKCSVNRDDIGMAKTPDCYWRKLEGAVLYLFCLLYWNNMGFRGKFHPTFSSCKSETWSFLWFL